MAFILALLAVGVGFAVKRWREDRKQRADEEYERRRWGQESALEVRTSNVAYAAASGQHAASNP